MNDEKIVSLHGAPIEGEVVPSVVECLEALLAEARAGRIGAVMAVVDTHQEVHWSVAGIGFGYEMIGAIEFAKADLVRRIAAK